MTNKELERKVAILEARLSDIEVVETQKCIDRALGKEQPKEEFEVNNWYKTKFGSIYFIEEFKRCSCIEEKHECHGYGISSSTHWITGHLCYKYQLNEKATPKIKNARDA